MATPSLQYPFSASYGPPYLRDASRQSAFERWRGADRSSTLCIPGLSSPQQRRTSVQASLACPARPVCRLAFFFARLEAGTEQRTFSPYLWNFCILQGSELFISRRYTYTFDICMNFHRWVLVMNCMNSTLVQIHLDMSADQQWAHISAIHSYVLGAHPS